MLKSLLLIGIISLFLFLGMYVTPIDYNLSHLPYNYTLRRFYGETHLWCTIVYKLIPVIVIIIVVVLTLLFMFRKQLPYKTASTKRFVIVVFLSLVIGPGLISNVILKDHWGRPRPYQVLRDNKKFRPFYKPEFGESKNNSFPSGHATIGFFLGVPLLALKRRRLGFAVSIIGGGIVGLVRILQGGHYLSDVIFSWIIVWFSSELIIYLYEKFKKV
ncbi:MAG: phosphatase PAP2 family protein [Neisseriaceae bacterium]|jgi:lipid A 4'-phosphatase